LCEHGRPVTRPEPFVDEDHRLTAEPAKATSRESSLHRFVANRHAQPSGESFERRDELGGVQEAKC
jgi:hypothetical protein